MRNERGMILPLTLIVLVALSSLTLALLSLASVEPTVSRNLAEVTQARYAAEAGIEAAFNTVAGAANWTTLLTATSGNGGLLGTQDQAIGGLSAARGTYTARLRNDNLANDDRLTGLAIDASPTTDVNGAVIITSAGRIGNAAATLRAVVKRPAPLLGNIPAALAFPGNEAQTSFTGNSFEIDGRGWKMNPPNANDPDDASNLDGGCSSVYGISVSPTLPTPDPGANEQVVEDSLSSQQDDNVRGKKQNAALPEAYGNNTIAPNSVLTPEFVKAYIDQAKQAADITLESRQADGGLSFNNVQWGTAAEPKIVYIKGEPDPSSMFNALRISGNSDGYGILIVEDGDLRISGNFAWHGAIIVTGKWVGVGFLGGGYQSVYGAVISNETAVDAGRYSCEALQQAALLRKLTTVGNWKELAPGE
jgi:Tfp pilus assembly protein PilX